MANGALEKREDVIWWGSGTVSDSLIGKNLGVWGKAGSVEKLE